MRTETVGPHRGSEPLNRHHGGTVRPEACGQRSARRLAASGARARASFPVGSGAPVTFAVATRRALTGGHPWESAAGTLAVSDSDAHRVREAPSELASHGRPALGCHRVTGLAAIDTRSQSGVTARVPRGQGAPDDRDTRSTRLAFRTCHGREHGQNLPVSDTDRLKGTTVPDNAGADRYFSLIAERRRGVLVTLKADGRPQLSNVDVTYDEESRTVRLSTTDDRAKVRNLRRDPRVSLHITTPDGRAYAVYEGVAELSAVAADPHDAAVEELIDVFREVQGEHPDWDEYRAAMVTDRRLVVRFPIDYAYGWIPS